MYLFIPKNKEDKAKIEEQLSEKGILGAKVIVDFEENVYKYKFDNVDIIRDVYPNNPNKEALIIDCANVIADTQHPLQRFDFNRTKQEKFTKCKECGSKTKLINRKIEIIDKYEYVVKNTYQCESCAAVQEVDNLKCANLSICEGCGKEFQSQGSLQMKKDDKGIEFNMVCICGHERLFRGLEYSKEELQELKLNDALNGATWKDVSIILKAECKKNNYHWKYSERLIETLKNKKIEPKQAIEKIKMVLRTGQKLAALNYA